MTSRPGKQKGGKLPRFLLHLLAWNHLAPGLTGDPLHWLPVVSLVAAVLAWGVQDFALVFRLAVKAHPCLSKSALVLVMVRVRATRMVPHFSLQFHPRKGWVASRTGPSEDGGPLGAQELL